MAVNLSTGAKNAWLGKGGGGHLVNLLRGGVARIYTGAQPANADLTESGTLLLEISSASAAFSAAVSSDVEITLSAGASGSVDSIKVGGMAENLLSAAVPFNVSLTATAVDVAANINANKNALGIFAVAGAPGVSDIMLYAPAWAGALADGLAVAVVCTTITVDVDNTASPATSKSGVFAGGTTSANGLNFSLASAGVISKVATETWSDAGLADGVAQYLRFYDAKKTTGASTTAVRLDMSVGTVGTDAIMTSTTVTTGVTSTVTSATFTL